ncbi:hypothetical protein BCR44DRAFT_1495767 [Catenaria anguillulae PL171]|uniref:acetate--CoA ligase n=1 Tax=Catenaria anguillulae PL171 TaxID=765915 RepID=A0A1Y2I330_9FUNG|nr:hypothetical protein BCR44DRAFT_1495767 [Catenaria anguillulae PL171]
MGDLGWITAHSYTCYGPLLLGITSVLFESTPVYPTPARYWQTIEKHGITQFYTSPTALRSLRRFGDAPVKEQICRRCVYLGLRENQSTRKRGSGTRVWWRVGHGQSWTHIGDLILVIANLKQTETGACCITPLPGATPTKPGSATVPFFGIDPVIVDPESGKELTGNNSVYFSTYPGMYMTGDAAYRDEDGYIWMLGRTDDIINVAGHRLSTSEVEGALVSHELCAEAAVVGAHDDVKGQVIVAFVTLKDTHIPPADIPGILTQHTRSGKIVRRVLRKIADGSTTSWET